jgi:hypothetical protein
MIKTIIISSLFFGSIFTFNSSLALINHSLLQDNPAQYKLHILNGATFIISGSIFIYGIYLIK